MERAVLMLHVSRKYARAVQTLAGWVLLVANAIATTTVVAHAGEPTSAAAGQSKAPSMAAASIKANGLDEYMGIRPWMQPDDVRAVLGAPDFTMIQKDGRDAWRYHSLAVLFDSAGRGVSTLFVVDRGTPPIAGVGIGSSEAEILVALGEPVIPPHLTSAGGETMRYGSEVSRIVFMLDKDHVQLVGLSWFKNAEDARRDDKPAN
jgi:hypothetical protein